MDIVLFACVHNAGRSQMAAAWFNRLCDRTKATAVSAGTKPGERVHPEVVQVMKEEGIDLANVKPQYLSVKLAQTATLLVTMGCGDACPYVPATRYEDWDLPDPKTMTVDEVRALRDDIADRVETLVEDLEPAEVT